MSSTAPPHAPAAPPRPVSGRARLMAVACAASLAVLAALVELGPARPLDDALRQWARPDDVWGALQLRADVVVEGLRPPVTLLLTAGVAGAVGVARRSLRPVLVAAAAVLATVAGTVGIKLLLHRPDPHGAVSDHGGSFPSGHTTTLVVCAGLVTLLTTPGGRRWWAWAPTVLLGALMAGALLAEAAHWATDLAGGALVGATLLALGSALGLDRWSAAGAGRPGSGPVLAQDE